MLVDTTKLITLGMWGVVHMPEIALSASDWEIDGSSPDWAYPTTTPSTAKDGHRVKISMSEYAPELFCTIPEEEEITIMQP